MLCHHPHPPLYLCLCLDRSCNPAQLPHPPNLNLLLSCIALYVFLFLLLHPAWAINVLTAVYCTLILSADRWRRTSVFRGGGGGVPVLLEDGWRLCCCQDKITFILHVYHSIPISVQITVCFSPSMFSWISVLPFSNHPLLLGRSSSQPYWSQWPIGGITRGGDG